MLYELQIRAPGVYGPPVNAARAHTAQWTAAKKAFSLALHGERGGEESGGIGPLVRGKMSK